MYFSFQRKRRYRWYTRFVTFFFLMIHVITLPIMLIGEKFLPRDKHISWWRRAARHINRFFFRFSGIRINLPKNILSLDHPVVFIANHPSMLDGFMYFSILGPNITPLTEPTEEVMFPFNMWFKKMGLIDVSRDDYDAHVAHKANTKQEAIQKLVDTLHTKKESVMIFPEGHAEKKHELEYIHTGACRVAIQAGVPIVMCTTTGFEHIYLDKHHMRPGTMNIHISDPIYPPQVSKKLPFRKAVTQFSDSIRDDFFQALPRKYIPQYINDKLKGIDPATVGIFVDIDNTIYKGNSQQHFVKYMMKHGELSTLTMVKIFHYMLLEKIGVISHHDLMIRALSFTRGWKERDMTRVAEAFFEAEVIPHLFHDMLPPLKDHQEAGHRIIFVTEVIEPLAQQFKKYFNAQDVVGTQIDKDKHGVYTGDIKRLCKGEEKERQLKRMAEKYHIDISKSYAYGDSYSDMNMLRCVRHPCAVRPSKKLDEYALMHHWEIIQ